MHLIIWIKISCQRMPLSFQAKQQSDFTGEFNWEIQHTKGLLICIPQWKIQSRSKSSGQKWVLHIKQCCQVPLPIYEISCLNLFLRKVILLPQQKKVTFKLLQSWYTKHKYLYAKVKGSTCISFWKSLIWLRHWYFDHQLSFWKDLSSFTVQQPWIILHLNTFYRRTRSRAPLQHAQQRPLFSLALLHGQINAS